MKTTADILARACVVAGLAAGVMALGGCRGDREDKPPRQFIPDMDDSPKQKPQSQTEFYADGRTMRQPPAGTVAYGRWDFNHDAVPSDEANAWAAPFKAERAALLAESDEIYRGRQADGKYAALIPIGVDADLLRHGQEKFNIYCAACHGYKGDGQGMVGIRWSGPVPSFHDPKYFQGSSDPDGRGNDGFLFNIALHGVAGPDGYPLPTDDEATKLKKLAGLKMPGYAHALGQRDAWAVVAYIRALQASVPVDQVPGDTKQKLEAERAKVPPAAAPAAPATGGKS